MAESVKKSEKIWLDGKFVAWDEARVPMLTHSLHYGLGVFEGIRCYKQADGRSAVFRLREHLQRLQESAHICLMEIPFSQAELTEVCLETMRLNRMPEGYLRPIAFMGDGAMGLGAVNPIRVAVACWPWAAYLGEEGVRRGIRTKISSLTRPSVNSGMAKGKITGQYVNSVLAKREAVLAGYDEAILLDAQGLVAEGSGENIFMVKAGVVHTPPLTSPILAGVTRDTVLRLARDKGMTVAEQTFTRDALYTADEVFFSGTAAEITPIREVDNRQVGAGLPGPVTKQLQQLFNETTRGEQPRYKEWLTYL
ncbi:MAG: branched-chain amino acid transaminase [Deltaproteobacteria bacterium]